MLLKQFGLVGFPKASRIFWTHSPSFSIHVRKENTPIIIFEVLHKYNWMYSNAFFKYSLTLVIRHVYFWLIEFVEGELQTEDMFVKSFIIIRVGAWTRKCLISGYSSSWSARSFLDSDKFLWTRFFNPELFVFRMAVHFRPNADNATTQTFCVLPKISQ